MTAEGLDRAVRHEVAAERKRPLGRGRREGRIHHALRFAASRRCAAKA
jgi:hypothetical protein